MFAPTLYAGLSSMIIIGLIGSGNAQANDTPVHFAKGQVSSTITGELSAKQHQHWYQFDAKKGQYTLINIAPRSDKRVDEGLGKQNSTIETANVGVLHMPDGRQDGTKGGIIYQGCLPTTGKYRLRIARNLMATHGRAAGYTAEIIILPKYASQTLCQD